MAHLLLGLCTVPGPRSHQGPRYRGHQGMTRFLLNLCVDHLLLEEPSSPTSCLVCPAFHPPELLLSCLHLRGHLPQVGLPEGLALRPPRSVAFSSVCSDRLNSTRVSSMWNIPLPPWPGRPVQLRAVATAVPSPLLGDGFLWWPFHRLGKLLPIPRLFRLFYKKARRIPSAVCFVPRCLSPPCP